MRGTTHLLFGLVLATVLVKNNYFENPVLGIILVLLASILPDVDERHSILGRNVPIIGFFFKHRTFFHSIIFLTICVIALSLILDANYVVAFGLGFILHLILDAMTPQGVLPFWPSQARVKGPIKTGSMLEKAIVLVVVVLFVILLV